MRIAEQSLSSATFAPWIPHDYYQTPPAITLAGFVSSGATLTWAVQFTPDDIAAQRGRDKGLVSVSQTLFAITVVDNGPPNRGGGHGLSAGDSVLILGTGIAGLDGNYDVTSVTNATTYVLTSLTSQSVAISQAIGAKVVTARVFTHAVLTGENGRAVSNYAFPVRASRLVVTAYTSGVASLEILQGGLSS